MTDYYSQNQEEKYITEYFKDYTGRLLEIGAFDAEKYSNSRKLILEGWEAVLIEPNNICCDKLSKFYADNNKIRIYNFAIGNHNGYMKFYDNTEAYATGVEEHCKYWTDKGIKFKETMVEVITWKTFYKISPGIYDFISIDTEGMDYDILRQIDLDQTKTRMICIEHTYYVLEIVEHLLKKGFKLLHSNTENSLWVRE